MTPLTIRPGVTDSMVSESSPTSVTVEKSSTTIVPRKLRTFIPVAFRDKIVPRKVKPGVLPATGLTSTPTMSESEEDLRKRLSETQYRVTCQCGTEPPFDNEYWDHKEPGIYVDIISGKPLFSSEAKFDSGTGWPSFFEAMDPDEIVEVEDTSHGMSRTEVRSKTGNAHLGHVFPDGPPPSGLRYCINSAALKFVPASG